MSEIPDDIMQTANEVVVAWKVGNLNAGLMTLIAQALLSERQRHAEVMEEVRKEARRQALEEAAAAIDNIVCVGPMYAHYDAMAEAIRALSGSASSPFPEQIANIGKEEKTSVNNSGGKRG